MQCIVLRAVPDQSQLRHGFMVLLGAGLPLHPARRLLPAPDRESRGEGAGGQRLMQGRGPQVLRSIAAD